MNVVYRDRGKLVFLGFEKLYESKFIRVREYKGLLFLFGTDKVNVEKWETYYTGFSDPCFKEYIMDYLERKGTWGVAFCKVDNAYFEMETEDDREFDEYVKECKDMFLVSHLIRKMCIV